MGTRGGFEVCCGSEVKSKGREVSRETPRLWPEQLDGVTLLAGTGMENGDFCFACFSLKCLRPSGQI